MVEARFYRRRTCLVALATGLVVAVAGCGAAGGPAPNAPTAAGGGPSSVGIGPNTPEPRPLAERAKVVVLYSAPAQSFMSLLLADHFQEFGKENIDVELRQVPTTDGAVLVARGQAQVQIAGFNASAFNLLAQARSPIRYTTTGTQEQPPSEGFYFDNAFVTNGKIDPVKVRDQQVSLGTGGGGFGNPGAGGFYIQAKEIGLPLDAVRPVTIPGQVDVATALLRGQIAGGSLFGAAVGVLRPEMDRFTMVQHGPAICVFVSNAAWLQEQPEVAAAFYRAIMRTNRTYLQGDYLADRAVLDAQVKILGSTPENVRADGLAKYSADLDASGQKALLPVFQSMFREAKVLSYTDDLAADQVFDESPVTAVLQGTY